MQATLITSSWDAHVDMAIRSMEEGKITAFSAIAIQENIGVDVSDFTRGKWEGRAPKEVISFDE